MYFGTFTSDVVGLKRWGRTELLIPNPVLAMKMKMDKNIILDVVLKRLFSFLFIWLLVEFKFERIIVSIFKV